MKIERLSNILVIMLAAVLISCTDYFADAINSNDQSTLVNKEFKLEGESSITYLAFTNNQMVVVEFDKIEQIFINPHFGPYVQKGKKIIFPLGMPGKTELSEIEFNLGYGVLTLKSSGESKSYDQM